MAISVGSAAPPFDLPGTGGRNYTLEEFRGHPLVIAFYPGDNSPVCTVQLNTYTKEFDELLALDARLVAVSPQGVDSHERFAHKQGGFAFPLLADEAKEVGKAYDILGPLGFYRRSIFVVDAGGKITYVHRSIVGATFTKTDELVKALS